MKTRVLGLVGLLCFASASLPASADAPESVRVGGLVVTVPSDWVQKRTETGLVLKPNDFALREDCVFTLLGGEASDGSPKDRLTEEWAGFEKLGTTRQDDGGKVDGAGNAVEVASRSAAIDLKNGNSILVWLLIAKSNGRIERMVFVAVRPEDFTKYAKDVGGMINGMRYVTPKPAEPLEGVCFGIVHVKSNVRAEPWIFLPKGVVFHGFPYGGPAHMDVDAMRKKRPKDFGEYRPDGNAVVVTMPGEESPTRFVDDGIVCEIDPGQPRPGEQPLPSAAPPAGGRGTYSITKNTLDFVYDGGEKVSLTFLAGKWDLEKGVPDGFYLDEFPLVKK